MGATESRQVGAGSSSLSAGRNQAPSSGYHVVRVAANSPAHLAGIEPFFDFCVGIDGQPLITTGGNGSDGAGGAKLSSAAGGGVGGDDAMAAWKALEDREGTRVVLNVWSSKRQELRDVEIIPSRSWSTSDASSSSDPTSQPSLLGLTLRPCSPSHALSAVWHILDILEESPAQSAGLVPFGDYVVGFAGGVLRHEGDFYDLVERHEGRPLRLYIYNSDYDHTREVIIVPNREWGGEGLLGCGVGFGLLHRIPRPQDRPALPPQQGGEDEETVQDGGYGAQATAAETSQLSSANNSFGGVAGGGIPQSSTDPNLRGRAEGRNGGEDGEEEDGADESHTSGVTISMRRDDDEDEEDEEHNL
ncbi:hypothetical protein BDZ90DRAFT_231960 [Jaminaea rosea]|uniref:PDZ GRASP-type domain-containing protein n=1 Tax=Jaminaea rosea TaxID=1569628 RepID=A0A316USE3_9BASI|nr:hypothetical protein BDZ90DRAFT_231960 [Jaminaea rosea]PWN28207.1 hypothetical protein BDZ90DRAFT_231960 [Jaminaea rosea]